MRPHLDALVGEPDLTRALTTFATVLHQAILAPPVVAMRRLVAAEAERFPGVAELYLRTSWQANIDALAATLAELEHSGRLRLDAPSIAAEQLVWMTVGGPLNARTLGDNAAADHDPGQRITHSITTFLARYGA